MSSVLVFSVVFLSAVIIKNFSHRHRLHRFVLGEYGRARFFIVQVRVSCMDNMETIIKAHNSKIINKDHNKTPETCNCRKKEDCPLPGKCTIQNVIYEAKVKTPNEEKTYIGLTATSFKARYTNHKASFNNRAKSNQTELSKHIWKLKDDGSPYTLTWTIKKRALPYSPRTKRCNLCLWEKFFIITADKNTTLNTRTELTSTCRHKRNFY